MRKQTRKLLGILLAAALLGGVSAAAEPPAERIMGPGIPIGAAPDTAPATPATPENLEEDTWAQALSVGMMCWNSYTDRICPWEPYFAWDATGWYAALLYRVEGIDLLPQSTVDEFQRSLGVEAPIGEANVWLGDGGPRLLRSADGSVNYDFAFHKQRLDELLGVELEFSVEGGPGLTETVTVRQHFDLRTAADRRFILTFEENGDPAGTFRYRITDLSVPEDVPEVDPNLTFDWELLTEQNRLSKILSMYPAVRIYSRTYNPDDSTWLFLHGKDPVMISEAYGNVTGQFRTCYFELGQSTDGKVRPQVGSFEENAVILQNLENYILGYFDGPAVMKLDRIEGDLIWADAVYRSGYRQKLAFDRGTLVLREVMSLNDDGEVGNITVFDYSSAPDAYRFLDSWDMPLRTIEVVWETYSGTERQLRRENVRLPADWEYLPFECRWGEFTAYTNELCIGDYQYPGDGAGYLLFLTTVKG